MSILAAFMVPHPPLIVSEIGKGQEEEVAATIEAYEKVAQEIGRLAPDTIIVSSPHAEAYADYFQFSDAEIGIGSFAQFGAPDVSFRVFYDQPLIHEISALAQASGFPAGSAGEKEAFLDHGTMVPLYFINHFYRNYKLVRLGLSGLPLLDHYQMGVLIKKAVESLGRRVVFVASGDLSHCQKEDGPYGFKPEGPKYDELLMKTIAAGNFGDLMSFNPTLMEKAEECGHRSFVIMAGALDKTAVRSVVLSHESVTGVGYGIAEFFPQGLDPTRAFGDLYLEKEKINVRNQALQGDPYVALARKTIEEYISHQKVIAPEGNLPAEMSNRQAGVFVSIHEHGELRGCIGTTSPVQKSIAKEIIMNAISAATDDPRFSAIQERELPYLDISVDVLEPSEFIDSEKELDPKRYGVIVENGSRRGLLLPDLPGVDTISEQIAIAKRKARIAMNEPVRLYRFEVVRHR